MGVQPSGTASKNNAQSQGGSSPKLILRLRSRDIILHYGFKMKAAISDLDIFPHELEGLRLWDIDVIVARYVILESDRFKGRDVLVVKSGVGLAGVALGKWTEAKSITLCDVREEVVRNGVKNCVNNGVGNVISFRLTPQEVQRLAVKYDRLVCPDLMAVGFTPQQINGLFVALLKEKGEAVVIMPQKKQQARKLLQGIDKEVFKVANEILTAQEYETSPLFNRLEGEKDFPSIGKSNFYALRLEKMAKKPEEGAQN